MYIYICINDMYIYIYDINAYNINIYDVYVYI